MLDQFIEAVESRGYRQWTITRNRRMVDGLWTDSWFIRIQGTITIEAREETLEDAMLTLTTVLDRLHGELP